MSSQRYMHGARTCTDDVIQASLYIKALHYENTPMQYTVISKVVKMKIFSRKILIFFLIFAQNIDCGYTLEPPHRSNRLTEAVRTSTHSLCFGAKIRKIGIPLHTPVFLYKSGV